MAEKQLGVSFDVLNPEKIKAKFEAWVQTQPPGVEIAITTLVGGLQGAALGGITGFASTLDPNNAATAAGGTSSPGNIAAVMGGPWQQARNFAVMSGVNAGLHLAIKKYRGGVEDIKTNMLAALGSGMAFSVVSGINTTGNPVVAALATGMSFAVLNGAFYKVGELLSGGNTKQDEQQYAKAKHMLKILGFSQYEKNIKKGLLTDNTIMLWNENALQDVKIPAGPRLLILHHINQYRHILKPAMPLPTPPPGYAPLPAPSSGQ